MEIGVEGVTTPAAGEVRGESPALWEQAEEAPPVWRVVLLMCRTVVEAHHGRLETAARPQEGRSFAVFFPRG